ncbi:ABC transporter permease subunit [Acetobacter orientalis]|uniref:ABC transporter permease subunit n=1 Tax=Acetobacter orientalis TaxID=146474 RepID=UPI0039EB29F6
MKPERPDFIIKPRILLSLEALQAFKAKTLALFVAAIGFLDALGCFTYSAPSLAPATAPHAALGVSSLLKAGSYTALRMGVALCAATVFAGAYAVAVHGNRYLRLALKPLHDVIQAIPALVLFFLVVIVGHSVVSPGIAQSDGIILFTLTMALFGRLASSFHHSLKTLPADLEELAQSLNLTTWQKFWKIECPSSFPVLVLNASLAMAEAWFALLCMEGFLAGANSRDMVSGVGAFAHAAAMQHSVWGVVEAALVAVVVLIVYDQFLFRPLMAWSTRFQMAATMPDDVAEPWFLRFLRRNRFFESFAEQRRKAWHQFSMVPLGGRVLQHGDKWPDTQPNADKLIRLGLKVASVVFCLAGVVFAILFSVKTYSLHTYGHIALSGSASLARVLAMLVLCSLFWVPIAVYIGRKPKVARPILNVVYYLSLFPANIFYPLFALAFVACHVSANVWVAPILLLGGQLAVFSAVVEGMLAFPASLLDVGKNFQVQGWLLWRKMLLPGILPYYIVGLSVASASAWNAVMAVEVMSWGNAPLTVFGLGAYVQNAINNGEISAAALAVSTLVLLIMLFNLLVWQPLTRSLCRALKITDEAH